MGEAGPAPPTPTAPSSSSAPAGAPGGFSTREALATIARATAFEQPLRRRVEGVTWMVWGLVTGGLLFSSGATEALFGYPGPAWAYLYIPFWLLAGVGATAAVWRIASLAAPEAHPGRGPAFLAIVLASALVAAIWLVAPATIADHDVLESLVLFTIAVPWLAVGAVNPHRGTAVGRRVLLAIGAALLVAGALWATVLLQDAALGFAETTLVTGFVGAAVPLVAGMWQTLRG